LNAPLPAGASYGYHVGGWGKPPVDVYGRPLYGGDPFAAPEIKNDGMGAGFDEENEDLYGLSYGGAAAASTMLGGGTITSDGKALGKQLWGSLPSAFGDGEEEEEEESSSEEESSEEDEDEDEQEEGESQMNAPPLSAGGEHVVVRTLGMDSVLPDGVDSVVPSSAVDLRKPGDETPMMADAVAGGPPKQLYTILQQTSADKDAQQTSVFASDHVYVLPGGGASAGQPLGSAAIPEGAASVLSKSVGTGVAGVAGAKKRARTQAEDDEADELGKKFKF
jgi:splicing factor 3B subunit 2